MPLRKRPMEATETNHEDPTESLLSRLRNMWEFANLGQWIYLFGKAAKIDNAIDTEELETECLKPNSTVLDEIALAILKLVSSHRGLTHSLFDDQARKQYLALAPNRNPFGAGDEPEKFSEFDVFTKIRVMQQLTQWSMRHPERIREKMDEQRDIEQTEWRIEPYGWDSKDRTYYVLDDNRVYRLTEASTSSPSPSNKKAASRSRRQSNKRRRLNRRVPDDTDDETSIDPTVYDNGLGGMTWECVAVTLSDVQELLQGLKKSRDKNEEILKQQLQDHLLPILEKQEESRKRKEMQREKELLNLAKMANAKRSSRIAGKVERQKQEESVKEEKERVRAADIARKREEQKQAKIEQDRDLRLASREQRLREREARRLQHEEELAALSEDSMNAAAGKARISERQRQVEISKNREALKQLEDEEDWVFDCVCGMFGHVDDGTHSVACERCNVWQHSKCLGISEGEADRPDFHFVCKVCQSRQDINSVKPKTTIKLKVNHSGDLGSPQESLAEPHGQAPASKIIVEVPAGRTSSSQSPAPLVGASYLSEEHANGTEDHADGGSYRKPDETTQVQVAQAINAHSSSTNLLRSEGSAAAKPVTEIGMTPSPILSKRNVQPLVSPLMNKTQDWHHSTGSPSSQQANIANQSGTPRIERNGFPIRAGISPTKHSPRPMSPATSGLIGSMPTVLPPITLSPSSHEVILTPPIKSSSPPRPNIKEA